MSEDNTLNSTGKWLASYLESLESSKDSNSKNVNEKLINVAGVGRIVSSAYEQLRNAAEYSQDHLLIQNAIRRFFVRNLFLVDQVKVDQTIAEELIVELTQAGYIKNNSQPVSKINELFKIINQYFSLYKRLQVTNIDQKNTRDWVLDLMSIGCEELFIDNQKQSAYIQFAYKHYLSSLNKKSFIISGQDSSGFEASLYIAVHKSLINSDLAAIRFDMNKIYKVSTNDVKEFINFNNNLDYLYNSEVTKKLARYINKYGAPLRILRSMIKNHNIVEDLKNRDKFKKSFQNQVKQEYKLSRTKLNNGLLKSIAFLVITKSLIGLAVEVPYDILINGEIKYVPLFINLFTPVIYLAVLRLGIKVPSKSNAKALWLYADEMLYSKNTSSSLYPSVQDKKYPIGFKIAYGLMFVLVFGLSINILMKLNFDLVQSVIFFIFLAAASFLGFRLSKFVKELELVTTKQGIISALRDFLFMPFTFLGKQISDNYQKINIVALVLDTFIELPLKTVLRLFRQWMGFIDDKKEEL